MKTTLQLKLLPDPAQHAALEETMRVFNDACNYIAEVAYRERCASKFQLQKLLYAQVRQQFGLSAQLTIRAISKVVEAYKRDKDKPCFFRPTGAVVYDQRIMSFKGLETVSLLSLQGRLIIPIQMGHYQRVQFHRGIGQADLILVDGQFYLLVVVDTPEEPPYDPEKFLGVDLGIVRLATDSDGQLYSGAQVDQVRQRFHALRQALQKRSTKSAKRHLKRLSKQESRFRKDRNHCIAKHLVRKAQGTGRGIALEDLKGIRVRITVRKAERARHSGWAFYQLQQFIAYKAAIAGVPVAFVDPYYTSRECSECHHADKANRKSQSEFSCVSCGYTVNADFNASCVVAQRAGMSCGLS